MNKVLKYLLGVLIVLVGVGLVSYPTVSNWWNEMHTSKAMRDYDVVLDELDEVDIEALRKSAHEYNVRLSSRPDPFAKNDGTTREYYDTLDVTGTGIMAYLTIPKLDVKLPVYHGVDDSVLQTAVGHMEGSSLPVGGENTHCLLSGHRGLPSAKLFTRLDEMAIGDIFYLNTLDELLVYRVCEINTVLPTDTELLEMVPGKDLVTLITCTPYGRNTHRLLVRGERVDDVQNRIVFDAGSTYESSRLKLFVVFGVLLVGVIISVFGLWRICRRRSL